MGYESSETARRRLGARVMWDEQLWETLAQPAADVAPPELDAMMRELLAVPGAAGALCAALAAQSRALRLVWEAERRGVGALPADVVAAVRSAVQQAPDAWMTA